MSDLLPHHRRAALALNAATLNHRVAALSTGELADMSLDDGRTIVADNVHRWIQRGYALKGWSANMMNPSRQEAHGLNEPIVGAVMDHSVIEDGQHIDLSRFHTPLIGTAMVVRLNMELPQHGCTTLDIRRCVSSVLAGLLIVDSRLEDPSNGIAQQADNGGFGAIVLPQRGKALTKVDVKSALATLTHEGKTIGEGSGMTLMGDPLEAATWMANVIGDMGERVGEGDVLVIGACTPTVPLTPGTWTGAIQMVGEVTLKVN